MPITKGAIRKQRADKRKAVINSRVSSLYRQAVKVARRKPTVKSLSEAFQKLDRAAKAHVIHKNKAARLKSRLSKLMPKLKPATKLSSKSSTVKKSK